MVLKRKDPFEKALLTLENTLEPYLVGKDKKWSGVRYTISIGIPCLDAWCNQ